MVEIVEYHTKLGFTVVGHIYPFSGYFSLVEGLFGESPVNGEVLFDGRMQGEKLRMPFRTGMSVG